MMAMGVILAHVAVFRVVQVIHVGMTAVLLSVTWGWLWNSCPRTTLPRRRRRRSMGRMKASGQIERAPAEEFLWRIWLP